MKTLFITFTLKQPAEAEQLLAALRRLDVLGQQEEGRVQYQIYGDEADERLYYMLETWSSAETLQAHLAQPHVKEFGTWSESVLTEPFHAQALTTIS